MPGNTSPFQKTELLPIEESYSKKASLFGLRKPDGSIIINYDHNTRYGRLKEIADMIGCEVVTVKGTWTFTPDRIDEATGNDE